MEKFRYLVLDEPVLYLFGALVFVALLGFGLSFNQAATLLFWWYVGCATIVGLYMTWCNFIMLMMSLVDKDTPSGWNWENRPSIQDWKEDDPVQARALAGIWDQLDQTMWKFNLIRLLLVISLFISLPLGAYFLRESIMEVINWWKLALALALLTFGFVNHHRYNQ